MVGLLLGLRVEDISLGPRTESGDPNGLVLARDGARSCQIRLSLRPKTRPNVMGTCHTPLSFAMRSCVHTILLTYTLLPSYLTHYAIT